MRLALPEATCYQLSIATGINLYRGFRQSLLRTIGAWGIAGLILFSCAPQRFAQVSPEAEDTRQRIAELIIGLSEALDDPSIHDAGIVQDTRSYYPRISAPYWIIPDLKLPDGIKPQKANNNVSICVYSGRLYVAFRTAPHHFASRKAALYVVSSSDLLHWRKELIIREGRDVREPHLIVLEDTLHLYYFVGGTSPWAFEPATVRHYTGIDTVWQQGSDCLSPGEVPWDVKKRFGKLFTTSYRGAHYKLWGPGEVQVCFRTSVDGREFRPVGDTLVVYMGGASECAFEFDADSTLWIVTRLDDGDRTGFGSHVGWASAAAWHRWQLAPPDPHCYMSPKLFRHRDQLYLIARRQLSVRPFGWADRKLPLWAQRLLNWIPFSLSSMTTSLYRLDKLTRKVVWIADLPGSGDTAFPSIQRLTENTFLIANYSSPLSRSPTWLRGQFGPTGIYLLLLDFTPSLR